MWTIVVYSQTHGRLHIGADGVSWPPEKRMKKIKKQKHAKEQFSEWGVGRCRERR